MSINPFLYLVHINFKSKKHNSKMFAVVTNRATMQVVVTPLCYTNERLYLDIEGVIKSWQAP